MATSATLICGAEIASYADFHQFYRLIRSDRKPRSSNIKALFRNRDHLHAVQQIILAGGEWRNGLFTLFRLLRNVRQLEATDPRDHILGVLGLSDHFKAILPPPDYSFSASQLFTEVTMRFLRLSKSLYILTGTSTTNDKCNGCPSWVIDVSNSGELSSSLSGHFGSLSNVS